MAVVVVTREPPCSFTAVHEARLSEEEQVTLTLPVAVHEPQDDSAVHC